MVCEAIGPDRTFSLASALGIARVNAVMLAIAVLVCGVWVMDHLTTAGLDEVRATPEPAPDSFHRGTARVFVLLVDSLRYDTATDPARMPYLASLRGVRARVTSSRDAVTVSAIREMFTGRERFLAFGFVKDFLTGRESVESIFTQLGVSGRTASVYPPYAFEQFADDIPPRPVDESVTDRDRDQQDAWVREGLSGFLDGQNDFSVAHIVYSDRVAHDVGIHGAAYLAAYRRIDDLIRELDAAIPPEDTLVIAGDHGHTDDGRHSLGLDVPTFALYRGAAFCDDMHLGTIPIAAHRYLLGWAAKLPLSGGYQASRHPEALAPVGASAPSSYGREGDTETPAAGSPRALYLAVAMTLGLVAGLWLGVVWRFWRRPLWASAAAWAALGALALIVWSVAFVGVAVAICIVLLADERRRGAATRHLAYAGLGAVAGALFHGWGSLLAAYRDLLHEPSWADLERLAALLILAAGGLAWRVGAARVAWWIAGGVGMLAHATVYRYGTMPGLVTVWLAWLAATAVSLTPPLTPDGRVGARTSRSATLGLAAGVVLLIQPFAFADAGNFQMHSWHPWIPSLVPSGHDEWVHATLIVKLVIFARWRVPHWVKPLGVGAAFALQRLHWGAWHPSPAVYMSLIGALAAAGALAPRLVSERAGREIRRVSWLGALYLAYYYTIRIPNDHYMWADCFFAALSLSARLAARHGDARGRAHHYAILIVFGVAVAGWVTIAWTLHLYEWKFIYELLDPGFVEEHALLFVPLINGRYLIPVLVARLVVHEGFAYQTPYPKRLVWTAAGAKIISLVLILTGLGYGIADSDVYLEAIQEAAALSVFVAALL